MKEGRKKGKNEGRNGKRELQFAALLKELMKGKD